MTAVHMDSSSTTTLPPPPWLPVLHDFTPASSFSHSPSPPAPASHHHSLLPRAAPSSARRRVAKRRPSPRRLATTYMISADPASFRRMVQQVTGAADFPRPNNATELLLTRPAPVRAGAGGGGSTSTATATLNILPTLDTSAFLVGALSTNEPSCDGSAALAAAAPALDADAGGARNSTGGGFPTLESWDHHAPLFRD